jgi:hypothetical protein
MYRPIYIYIYILCIYVCVCACVPQRKSFPVDLRFTEQNIRAQICTKRKCSNRRLENVHKVELYHININYD